MMNAIRSFSNGISRYISQIRWYDLGLIKLCLGAAGVIVGLAMPPKARKMAGLCATSLFFATYAPLMFKFFRVAFGEEEE